MTKVEIYKEISKKLNIPEADINDDLLLKDDLKIDSIDLVEMVMDIEDEYGIVIDNDEAASIKSIGDLVKAVEGK